MTFIIVCTFIDGEFRLKVFIFASFHCALIRCDAIRFDWFIAFTLTIRLFSQVCLSFDLIACQISSSCRLTHCTSHCACCLRPHQSSVSSLLLLGLQLIDNSSDWHNNRGHNFLPYTRHRLRSLCNRLCRWYLGYYLSLRK